jgi:diaminopimelate decarboxylase
LAGVHAHIRSNVLSPAEFGANAHKLAEFAMSLAGIRLMPALRFVDFGSGIPAAEPILAQDDTWQYSGVAPYAAACAEALRSAGARRDLTLIIEPGRSVVATAGQLLCRVVSVKWRSGEEIVIVDGGVNMVPGARTHRYRIAPLSNRSGYVRRVTVHWALCDNLDVLGSANLAAPVAGDLLTVHSVGAYDMAARSFNFIRPRPAVIWVASDGELTVVRREETFEDWANFQRLAPTLKDSVE